jgi:ComF family protein
MKSGVVCDVCWTRIAPFPSPRCERCGHPGAPGGPCAYCAAFPPFVRAVRSVCWVPGDPAGAIVHALKYDGWTALAEPMGERMARLGWPADVVAERTAYVPVPLAAARQRERGFNQAELLARAVARRQARPVWADVLRRERFSATQTRLTPSERAANVHQAFHVSPVARARIAGTHLVLVDDVLTTGATLNAAATVLFEAGARIISYLTFGRARSARD